jgi:N-acetylneuraminate synthase
MSKISNTVNIAGKLIGDNLPVFVIAEIGINHNGSLDIAKKMIDGALFAGADAVKFQKRTPELCVPADQWQIQRDTPWGKMSYIDYKRKMEFNMKQYFQLDLYCREKNIIWFASCWDVPSVDFLEQFEPPVYKISSACITDLELLEKVKSTNKPVMISTGMSTMEEIDTAVNVLNRSSLLIAHSTSAYPCKPKELNLRMIQTLKDKYPDIPIGYSGHEVGLATTYAAIALGACFVERHITLDRAMWGTDQAASVEILGMYKLVHDIKDIEQSLGDGIKKVYESEISSLNKLRKIKNQKSVIAA